MKFRPVLSLILSVSFEATARPAEKSALSPFTVADSIESTKLHEPYPYTPVSPDGTHVAFVTEKGDLSNNQREFTLLVFDQRTPTEKSLVAAKLRSSSNRDGIARIQWLDKDTISFVGENPGEVPQIYLWHLDDKSLEKITADPIGVQEYSLSRDRNVVAYSSAPRGDNVQDNYKEEHGLAVSDEQLTDLISNTWQQKKNVKQLFVLNRSHHVLTQAPGEPFTSPLGNLQLKASPDGKYVISRQPAFAVEEDWERYATPPTLHRLIHDLQGSEVRDWGVSQIVFFNVQAGKNMPIDAPTGTRGTSMLWAEDGHSAFIAGSYLPLNVSNPEDLESRKRCSQLAEIEVPSLAVHPIAAIPDDEQWVLKDDPQKRELVVERFGFENGDYTKSLSAVTFTKIEGKWVRHNDQAPPKLVSDIGISQALEQRPKLVSRDEVTRELKTIFDPNPQFDHFQFGRVEVVHWAGKRNEALLGGLVYPTDYKLGKRYPLVIQTHGFDPDAFLQDGPFTTAMAAQELANKGIAVLQIGESPLYDAAEGTSEFGPVNLSQVESAIDYLDNRGIIDRNRVGLVGFSSTAYVVRYALTFSKYHIAAATAAEGNDWGYWTYVASAIFPSWAARSEMLYGGTPWQHLDAWVQRSVSFNYEKIHTPLRLESDQSASAINPWENFIALKRLHKPVELICEFHGDHPVVKPWDRMTSQQGNVDWMVFWLKGEEDPDPNKADQYSRWHKLRELQESNLTHR